MPKKRPVQPKDSVARRIRIALAEDGREDREIAAAANISAANLGSYKQGLVKNPPLDKLRSLAKAVGKPTSYFTAPLGYVPIEENGEALSAAEAAILSEPGLSEDRKAAALVVIRDLFARSRERAG